MSTSETRPSADESPSSWSGSVQRKILGFHEAPGVFDSLRAAGRTIVQCHGTFDLMHPGHIIHLEEARGLGDLLVVTVTGEQFVEKGPGRPYFNDQLRAHSLAALSCVDYVVVIPHKTAVEAIRCVRPTIYCKGHEYAEQSNDVTGNIADDVRVTQEVGGVVRYVGSVVYSSTRLLNNHFDALPRSVKDRCRRLAERFSPTDFRAAVESFADLNVLVIGDTIFDRYSFVSVQGLTSKNRIISGRFLDEETQAGGALAVFRHVKDFAPNVKFISLTGDEPWVASTLAQYLSPDQNLVVRDPGFTTVVKQRYAERLTQGKELGKLFSVNYLDAEPPKAGTIDRLGETITRGIEKADVVLLLDFGHGMMQERLRDLVQSESRFLALNCQTNSNNHGFNIINRQYRHADALTLDEQEMMLACGRRDVDHGVELERLRSQLDADYAWLTRGPVLTIGIQKGDGAADWPPLEQKAVDTIGAGDAFFSVAALSAARGLPVDLGTFVGQLAGAQAVRVIGNAKPISKAALLKSGMSLLNF